MAAPAFGTTAASSVTASGSLPLPTGLAAGDRVLIILSGEGADVSSYSATGGTVGPLDDTNANIFYFGSVAVYFKALVFVVTDPATADFSVVITNRLTYIMAQITGSPFAVPAATPASQTTSGSTAPPDPPLLSANSSAKDTLFLAVTNVGNKTYSYTTPTGYTVGTTRAGSNSNLAIHYKQATGATSDNPGATGSTTGFSWACFTLAFVQGTAPVATGNTNLHGTNF